MYAAFTRTVSRIKKQVRQRDGEMEDGRSRNPMNETLTEHFSAGIFISSSEKKTDFCQQEIKQRTTNKRILTFEPFAMRSVGAQPAKCKCLWQQNQGSNHGDMISRQACSVWPSINQRAWSGRPLALTPPGPQLTQRQLLLMYDMYSRPHLVSISPPIIYVGRFGDAATRKTGDINTRIVT